MDIIKHRLHSAPNPPFTKSVNSRYSKKSSYNNNDWDRMRYSVDSLPEIGCFFRTFTADHRRTILTTHGWAIS